MRSNTRADRSDEPVEGEILEGVSAQSQRTRSSSREWKLRGSRRLLWMGVFLIFLPLAIVIAVVLSLGFWGEHILPVLSDTVVPLLGLSALVLIPLTFFDATKQLAARALYISSWTYWVAVWMLGFLITMQYWGVFAVITGLILFGVGVIPLGILASLLYADGHAFLDIGMLLLLAIGSRRLSLKVGIYNQRPQRIWKYFRL